MVLSKVGSALTGLESYLILASAQVCRLSHHKFIDPIGKRSFDVWFNMFCNVDISGVHLIINKRGVSVGVFYLFIEDRAMRQSRTSTSSISEPRIATTSI